MKYEFKLTEYFEKHITVEADDPVQARCKLLDEYADNVHILSRRKHYGGVKIFYVREVE